MHLESVIVGDVDGKHGALGRMSLITATNHKDFVSVGNGGVKIPVGLHGEGPDVPQCRKYGHDLEMFGNLE